jgi:hypothetical protein
VKNHEALSLAKQAMRNFLKLKIFWLCMISGFRREGDVNPPESPHSRVKNQRWILDPRRWADRLSRNVVKK